MTKIYSVGIWTVKPEGVAGIRELLDAFEPGMYEVSAEISASSAR